MLYGKGLKFEIRNSEETQGVFKWAQILSSPRFEMTDSVNIYREISEIKDG